jgi:hypothetical protein
MSKYGSPTFHPHSEFYRKGLPLHNADRPKCLTVGFSACNCYSLALKFSMGGFNAYGVFQFEAQIVSILVGTNALSFVTGSRNKAVLWQRSTSRIALSVGRKIGSQTTHKARFSGVHWKMKGHVVTEEDAMHTG